MDWTVKTLLSSRNSQCRLLDLPAELRDTIFEYALTADKPLVSFRLDNYQRESYQEATQPPLTRVNRQIRQESLPIFYQNNYVVLHAEAPKIDDTQRWLECIESKIALIQRMSFWIRYVTLTNDRSAGSGAISISIRRSKAHPIWLVDEDWRWVTVTRRPGALKGDAKYLIGELRAMLSADETHLNSPEGIVALMTDLKMVYTKEKMS